MNVRTRSIALAMKIARPWTLVLAACAALVAVAVPNHAQVPGDTRDMRPGDIGKIEKDLVPLGPQGGSIEVYVHVITSDSGVQTGDVSDQHIAGQMNVLNTAFAPVGWGFTLAGIDRTLNPRWFSMTPGSDEEREAKRALRRGGANVLNIYTAIPSSGSLGHATWPWDYRLDPSNDGIVLLYSTLPGGTAVPYDRGATAVHLVGHWMGLYHTFQGACQKLGDLIADTPAEQSAAFGCPIARNTCRDPGDDPTSNFMDFTDDVCKDRFTVGQGERIQRSFDTYRR